MEERKRLRSHHIWVVNYYFSQFLQLEYDFYPLHNLVGALEYVGGAYIELAFPAPMQLAATDFSTSVGRQLDESRRERERESHGRIASSQ